MAGLRPPSEENDMNVKGFIGFGIAACAGLACGVANAGGVHFGINVGIPGPVYAAPVYAAPVAPVYVAPAPVYAPPPPPPPVAYEQPAPVVYAQPAPVYAGGYASPAIVVGWHGGRYWDGYRYWNRRDWYAYHGGYRRW
jgi:hypothetical protein